MTRKLQLITVIAAAVSGFAAATTAHGETIFALNESGTNLFSFDSTNTGKIQTGKFITGMLANEQMLTIDIRPANSQIYAVGSFGNLYTLNPGNGAATLVAPITVGGIDGTNFGSDINPVADALRFTSDTGINYRINVTTGVATIDTTLAYAAGDLHAGGNTNVVGLAYTNNFVGAGSTNLYAMDSGFDTLVTLGATPNSGQLTTVGSLGVNATDLLGFDISGTSGTAFAAIQTTSSGISQLYTINLGTGAATLVGQIGGGLLVRDITVQTGGGASVPEPASLSVLGLGLAGLLLRKRRTA